MTTTLQNSIWPNDDGNLGNIKVQIPDGVNVKWPEGDALLGNCVYQNGKLVGFVDTKALTVNSSGSTTINYDYVNIELPFAEDAMTINRGPRSKYLFIKFNDKEVEEGIVYVRFEELSDETKALLRSATTIRDNVLYDENDNVIGEFNTDALLTGHNVVIDEDGMLVLDESTGKPKTTNGQPADILFAGIDFNTEQDRDIKLVTYDSDLSNLTNAEYMFMGCSNLTTFTSDLSSLTNGAYMFYYCPNLITFNVDLSSLTNGPMMFMGCSNLTTFTSDLSSLIDGSGMFLQCSQFDSFSTDLPNLTNSNSMFMKSGLSSFSSDLPKLTDGYGMFNGCSNLSSFSSDLSSLTYGRQMFVGCESLTSFSSNLSSLTSASMMFKSCKLDTASVQNIADTIKDVTSLTNGSSASDEIYKFIEIGIGNSTPNTEETTAFNNMVSKGWTVYVNGTSSSNKWDPASITPENGEEIITPLPYYAKPVPATEETASYVDANGNYYNIVGGQFIYGDDISTYGMFTCEEDAAANMRLTKIEKSQTLKLKKC